MADSSGDSSDLLSTIETRLTADDWRIDRQEVSPGVYQIAAFEPETEQRRLLAVLPHPDSTVQAEHCTWLAAQAAETDADTAELVAAGTVPDDVATVAREHDVSILDPATFAESADQPDAATDTAGGAKRSQSGGQQADDGGQPGAQHAGQHPNTEPGQSGAGQHTTPQQHGTPHAQTAPQGAPGQQTAQQGARGQQNQQAAQPRNAPQGGTPPQQPNAPQQQTVQQGGISNWSSSRLLTIGGGILAGISLFLPWVVSIDGSQSWNGMATEFSTLVLIPVLLVVLLPAGSWGRGWGRLSALVTLVIGGVMAAGGFVVRAGVSETVTTGTVELDGRTIPMAVVEGGVGLDVFMLAGVLVLIASLGGLVGSFQS
jgi:hypothetical protein